MALYDPNNEYDREKLIKRFNVLLEGDSLIELKEHRPKRTGFQNNYLHLILSYFALEFGYTKEEVKLDIFKRLVNRDIFETERKDKRGNLRLVLRSTAELSIDEMSKAIERFRNYSASEAQLYLPSPSDIGQIKFIETQVKNNDLYL